MVGRVGRAHGVRGELRIELHTDDPEARFAAGSQFFTGDTGSALVRVQGSRWHSGRLLVRFDGITDRASAQSMQGIKLYRSPEDRLDEPQAWYDYDLVGCAVRSGGEVVGTVTDVLHLPAQDALCVEIGAGRERLVPLVAELVSRVDIAARLITVTDVPGLLTDEPLDTRGGPGDRDA